MTFINVNQLLEWSYEHNSKTSVIKVRTLILILILEFDFIVTMTFNQLYQHTVYRLLLKNRYIPGQENPDSDQYY